jgi:release factor glutamine methyltransferase
LSLLSPAEAQRLGAGGGALHDEVHATLERGLRTLPDKPEETTASTLRALWHLAAGERLSAETALVRELPPLDEAARARLHALVARRLEGTPLAHLTERQRFMGLEMLAGPGALIPRRETEIVARAAIEVATRLAAELPAPLVVDTCTGSGNVAAAVAHAVPSTRVLAADLSPEAVALARRNVDHLGLSGRVTLGCGDLLAPFETAEWMGKVDLVTCNPPYISTGRTAEMAEEISAHEPRLAFDGGPLGVRILQRLIQEAPRLLRPGGWLAFEVGLGQGPSVAKRLVQGGTYRDVRSIADEQGAVRVLVAQLTPAG